MGRVHGNPDDELYRLLAETERRLKILEKSAGGGINHVPWTEYDPVLTGSSSNPNLGTTGTAVGWYSELADTVMFIAQFVFGGSGIAAGSGNYLVSLPIEAGSFGTVMPGAGYVRDNPSPWYVVAMEKDSSTAVRMLVNDSSGFVTNTNPWAGGPAASDRIYIAGFYGKA